MAQIQIPNLVPAGQATQQGIAGYQNALATTSNLKTQGLQQNALAMRNQDMAKEQQDRAELESLLMSTPPEQQERVGLEFLKARDPEKAAKLQADYINRFTQKARLDPENAAKELEKATGEKIEMGHRYSKLPIEGGEAYVDNFTGHVFQPNSAQELAAVKADFAQKLEKTKQEGREDLVNLKSELGTNTAGTARTTQVGNRIMQYNTKSGRYDIDVGAAPPKAPPATLAIYAHEDIDQWADALARGETSMTEIPAPIRGKVLAKTRAAGNTVVPKKVREQITALNSARSLITPLRKMVQDIQAAKDPAERTRASLILQNYGQSISGRVARAFGEVGTMNEGDINRAAGLIPGIIASNFDPTFANRELDWLDNIMNMQEVNFKQKSFGKVPLSGDANTPAAPAAASPRIVQRNKKTGEVRHSDDQGQTWQPGP